MANFTTTELGATSMEMINSLAQDVLNQASVIAPTLMNESARAVKGAKSVSLPRTGRLSVNDKVEGSDVTFQVRTYGKDTIDLDRHKEISGVIEDRADIQAMVSEKVLFVKDGSVELALERDTFLYTLLKLASAAAPDHRIAFAGATIAKEDILAARKLLDIANVPDSDRWLAINPEEESDLLAIAEFIRADHYGSSAIPSGVLGQLYGVTILKTNAVTAGLPVMYHRSSVAWASQIGPRVQTEKVPRKLGDEIIMDHLYGGIELDLGVRQVLLGSAT